MMSLPRRALSDLKVLVVESAGAGAGRAVLAGAASTLAFFPREGAASRPRRPAAARRSRRVAGPALRVRALMAPRSRACRWSFPPRARRCCREVQRLSVPGRAGSRIMAYKTDPREVRSVAARRGAARHEGLSARVRVQRRRVTTTLHPAACDAAVAVRLARRAIAREALEEWLFANQPGDDAGRRSGRRRARSGR